MPGLSPADKQYIADMNVAHQSANDVANHYLAADPADRNSALSEMARKSITDHAAESMKMAVMAKRLDSMMTGKGM